jgi:hypothetical protein
MRLRAEGYSVPEIAKVLGRGERYVRDLLRFARESAPGMMTIEVPDPIAYENLAPEAQIMLEPTVEAFERFFNRFSGRILPDHTKEWVQAALDYTNLLLNVPPRHAKSTIMSVWFPMWLVTRDRDTQILLVSQTGRLPAKFAYEISYHLAYNTDLITTFGRYRPEFTDAPWRPGQGELLIDGRHREYKSGDLSLQIRGAGQAVLGMEADWVIVDDPTEREIAASEIKRENESTWLHQEVFTRLQPKGHAVVIGQRVHPRDIFGALEKETRRKGGDKVFHTIKYPAVLDWGDPDSDVEPTVLWPDQRDFDYLMEQYDRVGGYAAFECMFQQNPFPEGEAFFQRVWIDGDRDHIGCLDRDREEGKGVDPKSMQLFAMPVRVVSIDPSPTRFTGIVVADVLYGADKFYCQVLETSSQRLGLRGLVDEIERIASQYAPEYLIFEQSVFARWLYEDPLYMQMRDRFRVIGHNTGRNKADPELGVLGMAIDFEFGRVRLPYGSADSRHSSESFIEELLTFGHGDHDDQVMALWFIKFNWKKIVPLNAKFNSPGFGGMAGGKGWGSRFEKVAKRRGISERLGLVG